MKKQVMFLIMMSLIILTGSCRNKGGGITQSRATGFAYEVIVVMDDKSWKGEAGEAIKAELQREVPALPQSEPSMKITYSPPVHFNGLLTYVRNILIVNVNPDMYTKVAVGSEFNKWARGQLVMTVNAPDQQSLIDFLHEHPDAINSRFVNAEMDRVQVQLQQTYSRKAMDDVVRQFGVELRLPSDMTATKSAKDFFWVSNDAKTGRIDALVYTFPYESRLTFTLDYLIRKRDSVLMENVPGSFPNSYMTTEIKYHKPEYKAITVQGKYCGEIRGLWRMEGDMMGGPFVSHARLDEANNRVVVVEGFVYNPEDTKRNLIRRIEAALYTLRLPEEMVKTDALAQADAEEK